MLSGVFCIIAAIMHVTIGQHGLDHPPVVVDAPSLEYANSHGSTCRAGHQASWVLSVRGLVPGFSYRLHFVWSLVDEQLGEFDTVFSTTTSSYLVRKLFESGQRGQRGASTFDLIAYSRNLRMDVAVWELYPGLTAEDSLIGARHMDSAINHVKVICNASGERTRVSPRGVTISAWRQQRKQAHAEIMSDVAALAYQPTGNVGDIYPPDGREEAVGFEGMSLDGEKEDQWQHNFSAALEDVRISYSETVVALEMLNRYGLDEWARNPQKTSDDGHNVSDLHIPAVVFNRHPDGRRESAESMMRAVGFRDITFQPTYDSATLDLAALENSGRVSASWDYFTTTLLLYTTIYLSSYCCTTQEECQVVGTISSRHWRGGPIYRLPRNCDTSRMPSTFWM
jgi:hypothetical protein